MSLSTRVVIVPLVMVPLVIGSALIVQPGLDRLAGSAIGLGFSKQGVMVEAIGGLETVKATAAGAMLTGRWQSAVEASADVALRSRLLSAFMRCFSASDVSGRAIFVSFSAMRLMFGVSIRPPHGSMAENPTSSSTM